ncbi:MAG TPA: cytochrome c1 [Gallionellaceae bacterium]|nr:cytochrome c1 [Gallionellaceae bacterium]
MNKHFLLPVLLCMFSSFAVANEAELDHTPIPTDKASVLRGAEQVVTVCGGCHGLKYIQYRNLVELGVPKETVDAWRGDKPLNSAVPPAMDATSAQAAFGVAPPDLSLMTLAREGGVHYLYSYLMGYKTNEKGESTNTVFEVTRMPDILGSAATDPKAREEASAKAKDVTAFLNWAADPHAEDRKTLGMYVLAYLAIMTLLFFLWKKQIWRKIDAMGKVQL